MSDALAEAERVARVFSEKYRSHTRISHLDVGLIMAEYDRRGRIVDAARKIADAWARTSDMDDWLDEFAEAFRAEEQS